MEDIKKDTGNGELKPDVPKDITLTITLKQSTGELSVQAPGNGQLFDEPLCFWLLKKAERHIEFINAKAQQSRIITAPKGGIINFVKGKRF